MISAEDFQELVKSVENNEQIPTEKVKELVTTIYEMDANLVILQNCLQLATENARDVIPAVAEKVLSMAGRTDTKSKNKAAKFAADVTARFEIALQMYLAGAAEKAQEILNGTTEDTETEPTQQEETDGKD